MTAAQMWEMAKEVLAQGGFALIAMFSFYVSGRMYRDREKERRTWNEERRELNEEMRKLEDRALVSATNMSAHQRDQQAASNRLIQALIEQQQAKQTTKELTE